VDLQKLGLDNIVLQGQMLAVGAAVTLQQLLTSDLLPPELAGVIRQEAAANLRQVATIAGSLVAADGRSPLTAVFLGLDARLKVEPGAEEIDLGDLLPLRPERLSGRLITQVAIPLNASVAYHAVTRTPADWPLVCAAVVRWPGGRTRITLGGFGSAPVLVFDGPDTGGAEAAAADAYSHAGDEWASAAYRQEMAVVLVRRGLAQVSEAREDRR
jgi:CO/xanthine dehydrogenase FAD-binding subunit